MERLGQIPTSESLIIVATGNYIGEGFDYPRLDTLFLVLPISWKGNIAQYAGRLHRDYEGKQEVRIYDYIDIRVPLCDSIYRKRLKGYASVGYGVPKSSDDNTMPYTMVLTFLNHSVKTFYPPSTASLYLALKSNTNTRLV